MIQFKKKSRRVMDAETILKNGASLKSHMSKVNKQMLKYFFSLCISMILLSACISNTYFVKGDGGRTTVQIADRVSYNLAFDEVITILMKKFELEMISKESGYLRTAWMTRWTSKEGQRQKRL